jgi:hypothetical protein
VDGTIGGVVSDGERDAASREALGPLADSVADILTALG